MELDSWASAYRHGVAEADIRHAVEFRVKSVITENDMVMIIGPARDGAMLEVGLGSSGDVVHAMSPVRRKYWP